MTRLLGLKIQSPPHPLAGCAGTSSPARPPIMDTEMTPAAPTKEAKPEVVIRLRREHVRGLQPLVTISALIILTRGNP